MKRQPILLKNMDLTSVPVRGRVGDCMNVIMVLSKDYDLVEASTQFGAKQVLIWQRHFSAVPDLPFPLRILDFPAWIP